MNATTRTSRTWTTVGAEYVDRLGKKAVESEIETLEWQEIPEDGSLTVAYLPGDSIKQTILQLDLPRVSAIAISGFERPGFYPGFYGIEANYTDGRARIYVLDTGTGVSPLAHDFWAEG